MTTDLVPGRNPCRFVRSCRLLVAIGVIELAQLALTLADKAQEIFGQFDRLLFRVCLQDGEASHYLFGLREGTVGHSQSVSRAANRWHTALAREQEPGLHSLFGQLRPDSHFLRR